MGGRGIQMPPQESIESRKVRQFFIELNPSQVILAEIGEKMGNFNS